VIRGVSRAAEPPPPPLMLTKKIQPPPMSEKILRFPSRRRRCLKQLIKFSAAADV
jgi:hypothetical protein